MASTPVWVKDGSVDEPALKGVIMSCGEKLKLQGSQEAGARELYSLIMLVWSLETRLARDAADFVCDEVRETGCLESLVKLCSSKDKSLQLVTLKALEQVMVAKNREFIASHKLFDSVVEVATSNGSLATMQAGTGILENLFKESTQTCLLLIRRGALEGIILGCRSSDPIVLQHCAAALANCAMYGEEKAHAAMVAKYVDHWLFPLAFSKDEIVKYYALLAICFLAANPLISHKVAESGTLDLVLPFLNQQDPEEFTQSCPNHAHGRSSGWLKRLVPLLVCQSEEARSLVAFHFAMEAGIKKKQGRLQVFSDIGVFERLQAAGKSGSRLTAKLCIEALRICEVDLPEYQCWNVINWSVKEVSAWVRDTVSSSLSETPPPDFTRHHVTGSVLLDLDVDDLMEIGFNSRVFCRWFLEEIRKLRCLADISEGEGQEVCQWLTGVSKELDVYRPDFARKGITRALLPHLTEDILAEIGVSKRLDRLRLKLTISQFMEESTSDTPDQGKRFALPTPSYNRRFDVFISYRRATGSQLASLLKVHLQLRGLSVFLDVAELGSGKFDEAILTTISRSDNFVLVLSESCLDRCKGDTHIQDWLHKEILCAVENDIHSVPVIESNFKWPGDGDIPADIKSICKWNGVSWSHEYQEASVEKLISFLKIAGKRMRRDTRSYLSFSSVASGSFD